MNLIRWSISLALTMAVIASAAPKKKPGKAATPAAKANSAASKNSGLSNINRAHEAAAPAESPAAAAPVPTRGPQRIDFDDRLIQGQTNKSGAVYLYDRKELKTKSMVKTRETFREEIVGSLYDS